MSFRVSYRVLRRLVAALALVPFALAAPSGCSTKTTACAQSDCKPNNVCAGSPAVCSLKCNLHSDCPDGYACREAALEDGTGSAQVCQALAATVPTGNGGYLTSCSNGLEGDCNDGWVCDGVKAQPDAVCTQLDACQSDADCPPSAWCGELRRRTCTSIAADRSCGSDANCSSLGPGWTCFDAITQGGTLVLQGYCEKVCKADTDCGQGERCGAIPGNPDHKRCFRDQPGDWCDRNPDSCGGHGHSCRDKPGDASTYATARACVPRTYCSPCRNDADCNSLASACLTATDGSRYCSNLCAPGSPATCSPEAACTEVNGEYRCVPRAGSCFAAAPTSCSPCREDSDCGPTGVCNVSLATGERSCALPCDSAGKCPDAPGGMPLACCTDASRCGSSYQRCLPTSQSDSPDPRYASGCWLVPCTKDSQCDASQNQICFPRAGTCIPVKTCKSIDDCAAYRGETCEAKTGLCRPAPCKTDADCPPCSLPGAGCAAGDQQLYATCDAASGTCLSPR